MKNFKLSETQIKKLCEAGGMAPSGGNIQPWLVEVSADKILVKLNPSRINIFLDSGIYASIFSLGSFVENIQIAANFLGLTAEIIINDPQDLEYFCIQIKFLSGEEKKEENMYQEIEKRSTNRKFHEGKLLESSIIDDLEKYIENFKHFVSVYSTSGRSSKLRLGKILGKADRIRVFDSELGKSMFNEFRWSQEEALRTKDGLDVRTLEMPSNVEKIFKLIEKYPIIKSKFPSEVFEDMTTPIILNSSHVFCFSIKRFGSKEVFEAGRAMERFWLRTTALGLSVHPWTTLAFFIIQNRFFSGKGLSEKNQKEISDLEIKLRLILGIKTQETPIFIFRLSRTKLQPVRSLRLPWTSYTKFSTVKI